MLEKPRAGETREGPAKVAVVVGAGGLLFLTFFLMARWEVRKVEVDSLGGLLLGAAEVEEEEEEEEDVWREAADG
jgi:hypothetical protein